jgi:hypothetical protein
MPISLSCPSCERKLTVKDELAGRKVKCPGCGASITVEGPEDDDDKPRKKPARDDVDDEEDERPVKKSRRPAGDDEEDEDRPARKSRREDEEKAARKPRKRPADDDDDYEDDRPRKKKLKKKKAKSNTGLIVGISVGAVVAIAAVVQVIVFAGGDSKSGGALRGEVDKETLGQLKRVGLAIINYYTGETKTPSGPADLAMYCDGGKDAELIRFLSSPKITIIWGVSKEDYHADMQQLIAYENQPNNRGLRLVVRASSIVEQLDEKEFQAAPKAKPSASKANPTPSKATKK